MKIPSYSLNTKKKCISAKFNNLSYTENGLILEFKNKQHIEISFDDFEKIYIKKFKINTIIQLTVIALPFILTNIVIQYAPYDLVIVASLFTIPPVLIGVINYKWYVLRVKLKNGSFYSKKVSPELKAENITVLGKVRKEHFNYYIKCCMTA